MADLRHKGDLGEEPGELVDYSSDQRDDQPASKRILLDQDEGENQSLTRNLQALSSLLAVSNQLNSQQLSTSVHSGIDPNSYTRTIYLGGLPKGATTKRRFAVCKGRFQLKDFACCPKRIAHLLTLWILMEHIHFTIDTVCIDSVSKEPTLSSAWQNPLHSLVTCMQQFKAEPLVAYF